MKEMNLVKEFQIPKEFARTFHNTNDTLGQKNYICLGVKRTFSPFSKKKKCTKPRLRGFD